MQDILKILSLSGFLCLSACSGIETEAKYPSGMDRNQTGGANIYSDGSSIFGEGGLASAVGKGNKRRDDDRDTARIGVNTYLWRAALQTVSFMPLQNADPFGGTITTDWYADPATPDERAKLTVLILGDNLQATNIKVESFRQIKKDDEWVFAQVKPDTNLQLENAILSNARNLRIADVRGE